MNWSLALPELVLACAGMALLVAGVLVRTNAFMLSCTGALGAFLAAGVLVVTTSGGHAYSDLFVVDAYSRFAKVLILLAGSLGILLALDWTRQEHLRRFEFPLLMLFSTVGMMLMVSASSLMTLYVGVELMSLPIYVLAAFSRENVRSAEAGLKYFVLGSLASGLLLYGISLVYGFAGATEFATVSVALSNPALLSPGLVVGVVFVLAGLAFKVSAVPFHMWTPDVYEGAPTPVTAFMGTAPKVAAMALLVRVMDGPFGHLIGQWQILVSFVAIASMLLGSLAAIGQRNLKRLMAYSSIGHMGYALIGLAAGSSQGARGVMIYLVTYVFMNAGTFAVILSMRRGGRSLEGVSDLAGLGRTDPARAMWLAIFMFSMAGIPPFAGFWGKYFIFAAAVQSGLWALAIIGVLTSVIGAFYYIRIIKVMYFDEAIEALDAMPPSLGFAAAATGLFTGLFFVFPAPIVAAAEAAARAVLG
ncbi:MAG: NADH-quinone oxidoreductase subunit NuoN [Alphaproteobacteria bacterium]|nr:NADH-quinone oxidoreductase subunit NuoN [Alphaproteobacteria bacterium]